MPNPLRTLFRRGRDLCQPGPDTTLRYFGTTVHTPKNGFLRQLVEREGVYERENLRWLVCEWRRRGGWLLDVGGNIGLMSAAVLAEVREGRVATFEPSPSNLPYLRRTQAGSPHRERWQIEGVAIGEESGTTSFSVSAAGFGAFDSRAATGRQAEAQVVEVPLRRLDDWWAEQGCPAVGVIKVDVEGFEAGVLTGAEVLLQQQRPSLVMEWNAENLRAAGTSVTWLWQWARQHGYEVFRLPDGVPVTTEAAWRLQLEVTESFLLIPAAA